MARPRGRGGRAARTAGRTGRKRPKYRVLSTQFSVGQTVSPPLPIRAVRRRLWHTEYWVLSTVFRATPRRVFAAPARGKRHRPSGKPPKPGTLYFPRKTAPPTEHKKHYRTLKGGRNRGPARPCEARGRRGTRLRVGDELRGFFDGAKPGLRTSPRRRNSPALKMDRNPVCQDAAR
jgi:hypothetical protein